MEIRGYKAFNSDMTNRYGKIFLEGETYSIDEKPKFGINGVGFHFCERLEDTLRYFPAMEEEIKLAQVTGLGDFVTREDDYWGYYDMYSTNILRIDKILTHEEIIDMFLNLRNHFRVNRFLMGFRLTEEEIELFRLAYSSDFTIQQTISYYQEGKLDTYKKPYQFRK